MLYKFVFSLPGFAATDSEMFTAQFYSGFDITPLAPETAVFAPNWVNVGSGGKAGVIPGDPGTLRSCSIPGFSYLSAGAIQIQSPSGTAVTVPGTAGGAYSQILPTGFIAPGQYTISGTPGSPVGLTGNLTVGSAIQPQTTFPPGTVVSQSQPFTIRWTGGDPTSLVKVTLTAGIGQGFSPKSTYSYAEATSGSLTINPACTGNPPPAGSGVVCGFGVEPSTNAQVTVEVLPNPDNLAPISVPGITGPVWLGWEYRYTFEGLTIGQ